MSPNPNPAGAGLLTITPSSMYIHVGFFNQQLPLTVALRQTNRDGENPPNMIPYVRIEIDHFPRVSPWVFAFWSGLRKCKIWVPGSKLDTPIIG